MANINNMEYDEDGQDMVNIRVTSGASKTSQDKEKEINKLEKNGNLSTEIERFQMERTFFCTTKIINMDASKLLPVKKVSEISKNAEFEFAAGSHPPPSPRSMRNLYA